MNDLRGKIALITGGSRGIGKAIAFELGKHGATVIINYCRNDEIAKETYNEFNKAGIYCKLIKADISSIEQCNYLMKNLIDTFGKIDILINNAGVSHIGLFIDMSEDEITSILNTNLIAPITLSKLALQDMVKRKEGRIINISSIWGEVGASCEVIYSATKGAINTFTKALAKEAAPFGVIVNAIAPGVIDTDMNKCFSKEEISALKEEIPLSRLGTSAEISKAVAFLCSNDCTYMIGKILTIDGGYI